MSDTPRIPLPRRLDKYLSDASVGSRTAVEAMHAAGRIEIGGERDRPLWRLVDPVLDTVWLDGVVVAPRRPSLYGMLHKPAGLLTAMGDPHGRPTVASLMPGEWGRMAKPVGRLDKPTTGALVLTDDGNLNHLLTHPSHRVWKTYRVTVRGPVPEEDPRLEVLRSGIELDGRATLPAKVRRLPGPDVPYRRWMVCQVEVTIREGRRRQVRRMIRAARLRLIHLERTHIGPLALGELPEGELRALTEGEVEALYEAAGGRSSARARAEAALRSQLERGRLVEEDAIIVRRHLARLSRP